MIVLALSLVLFTCSQPATDAWREHPEFVRGARAFEAERWDEAALAFEAAYADHPRPELVWAQAQALRFGGRCAAALPLYERFLATHPHADEIADAHTNIAACRELVGEAVMVAPAPPVGAPQRALQAVAAPPPRVAPPAQRSKATHRDTMPRPRRSPARDPWGHGLLWSGMGVAGIGAGLLATGHTRRDAAAGASTELEYQQTFAGAPALGRAGIAMLVTAGALVTAGTVHFAVMGARARRGHRTIARLGAGGR
jgi:hypothetical protein